MRGAPFNPEGAGVLRAVAGAEREGGFWGSNKRKRGVEGLLEPRSVLDNRRSPSPPTSTSTLSSSLGGGGSSDTAGVAAVADNRWPPSGFTNEEGGDAGGALRKEEWASELQPIPDALMGLVGGGGDRCGLGLEDWEAMLAESTASPIQEQTFLRWITRDMEEASSIGGGDGGGLKPQQLPSQGPVEFDGNGYLGFGLFDQGLGFEPSIEGSGGGASTISPPLASSVSSCGGFPHQSSNKIPPSPSGPAAGIKAPSFGNPPNNPNFSPPAINSLPLPPSLPPGGVFFHGPMVEKTQLFSPGPALNPSLFFPLPSFAAAQHEQQQAPPPHLLRPQMERHHSVAVEAPFQICPKIPFPDSGGHNLFLRRNQNQNQNQNQSIPQPHPNSYHHHQQRPMKLRDEAAAAAAHHQQQQQALVDLLLQAAELVEAGNLVSARGILARLNHQLPSPLGKPLLRSAFYFKEALHLLLANTSSSTPLTSPLDVMLKLSAYKSFSEVSPLIQFANFTCTQAILEELGAADRIHIVDFDIGVGGQWSSFMQELAHRRPNSPPLLKITAFVSPGSHHPLELHLTRENLSHFAADLSIPFEFAILSLDSFDPSSLLCSDEAIAVNLPVGSSYNPPIPALLRLVKHLSPKIVVSVDQGCDRGDLPFTRHFLHGLQSCMVLLDSIDAVGTGSDVAGKIERFVLQPRIEGAVLGRHRAGEKMLPWRTLFASAGFVPLHFSNFTEAQAECLMKRVQVRGFHVEKRQASLFLHWQHRELASVSAWRC